MKKKNNKKWTLVLVLLLVVSIGYAALASNLKINGTSGVKSATWVIYWNNVQVTQGSVATTQGNQARITDQAKTQVEYSVTLNEPGDFYEFTVDAVNNGTIDAMIAANGIVNGVYSDSNYTQTATLPKTVSYTVTYADGTTIAPKHLLAKKSGNTPTTETYKVRIEYKNDDSIDPEDLDNDNDHTYYFKFSVNYVQADDSKIARNGGNQTPSNPYLTRFDGNYTYIGHDSSTFGTTFNDEWNTYLRTDGTTIETCRVFGSGQSGTVCVAYNPNGYDSDFEDCSDNEQDYDGTGSTCLKGYTKAKLDEMLSKGAPNCIISDIAAGCDSEDGGYCRINSDGNVNCYDGVNYDSSCYTSFGNEYTSYDYVCE